MSVASRLQLLIRVKKFILFIFCPRSYIIESILGISGALGVDYNIVYNIALAITGKLTTTMCSISGAGPLKLNEFISNYFIRCYIASCILHAGIIIYVST